MITRFAPSPTGYLHIGHAFSALVAWRAAKEAGGRFLLRIEDIDQTRCRPAYEAAIFEDLAWFGLDWEMPVRRQSDHFADYEAALAALQARGLVYRCFRTRKEVLEEIARAPHLGAAGPEGPIFTGGPLLPDEEAARLAAGEIPAWRLSMARCRDVLGTDFDSLSFVEEGSGPNGENGEIAACPEIFGDVVIARKDAGTSYHLAVTHDDALQGVTHVIRGHDLFFASHLHVLLQALLGLPQPRYQHHPLLTDDAGKKFSKRDKAKTLRALREEGVAPDDLRRCFPL